jgi:uncharacterized BrkB/YihY/UPF0761 family membrane protein
MVAFIPLVITVVGWPVRSFQAAADAQQTLLRLPGQTVPAAVNLPYAAPRRPGPSQSTGLLSIGFLFFLWVSTRLVGTLRVVLRDIFDMSRGRGILAGKIFDIKMLFWPQDPLRPQRGPDRRAPAGRRWRRPCHINPETSRS